MLCIYVCNSNLFLVESFRGYSLVLAITEAAGAVKWTLLASRSWWALWQCSCTVAEIPTVSSQQSPALSLYNKKYCTWGYGMCVSMERRREGKGRVFI